MACPRSADITTGHPKAVYHDNGRARRRPIPRAARMPNFGYHLARAEGAAVRGAYAAVLPFLPRVRPREADFPFNVYAYSGEAALPEQVACIRSFLRHVGRPPRYTVVSDESYSARSIALLEALDPSVRVESITAWVPADVPERFRHYVSTYPLGRQLSLIMSISARAPALYVDSDILFFAGAQAFAAELEAVDAPARYLPDCQFSGDERVLRGVSEQSEPVNAGFVFVREKLDWSLVIDRFMELEGEPNFFTNQTLAHLGFHANGARPLPPDKFVLQLDDQFVYPDRYASPAIVMRHYVNPVRHKFWTTLWR